MKTTQYAEGYVSFWNNNGKWQPMVSNTQLTTPGGNKQYRIAIPVPEELLVDELPQQDKIKVRDDK